MQILTYWSTVSEFCASKNLFCFSIQKFREITIFMKIMWCSLSVRSRRKQTTFKFFLVKMKLIVDSQKYFVYKKNSIGSSKIFFFTESKNTQSNTSKKVSEFCLFLSTDCYMVLSTQYNT